MDELKFDAEEFRAVAETLVPSYQRAAVIAGIGLAGATDDDYDAIGTALTGERANAGFIFLARGGNTKDQKSLWGAIKSETYDLLCTNSKKYADERKEGVLSIKHLVLILATAIAGQFHLAVGVIVGAVTVALMSALKMGRNAWCDINQPAQA
jgi:hypothetical protein